MTMTYEDVMMQLESFGTPQNRKIYARHGCDIKQFGVSVLNLKKIAKNIKSNKDVGLRLFWSNNADAMYLSQWVVDVHQLSIEDFETQILASNYYLLIENAIPNIIVQDFHYSQECLNRWLHHPEPRFRQAAYSLFSLLLAKYDDDVLGLSVVKQELVHIQKMIHDEENRVKYAMNSFVISVGTYVKSLLPLTKVVANDIGIVHVEMGETSCKVPYATTYIEKVESMQLVGKKRK